MRRGMFLLKIFSNWACIFFPSSSPFRNLLSQNRREKISVHRLLQFLYIRYLLAFNPFHDNPPSSLRFARWINRLSRFIEILQDKSRVRPGRRQSPAMTWLANSLGRVFGLIKKWNRCTHHDHRWTGIIPLLLLFFFSSSFLIFNPTIYVNAIAMIITFPFFFPRGERKINVSFHTLLFFLFFIRAPKTFYFDIWEKRKIDFIIFDFYIFYIYPRNMIIIFRFNRQANIPFISHFIIANI